MRKNGWTKSSGGVEPEIISPTMGERKISASAAGHVLSHWGRAGASGDTVCAAVDKVVSIHLPLQIGLSFGDCAVSTSPWRLRCMRSRHRNEPQCCAKNQTHIGQSFGQIGEV